MIYRTNFDYELQLAALSNGQSYQPNKKINEEFSYLFLWMESGKNKSLLSSKEYSLEYYERIESLTLAKPPPIVKSVEASVELKNWWGRLDNTDQEINLNSKCWQNETFLKKPHLPFISGKILLPGEDIKDVIGRFYRPEYGFAGKNSFLITEETSIMHKGIVTKFHKKRLDISCYIQGNTINYYLNDISSKFSFKRSTVFQNEFELKKYFKKSKIDLNLVKESFLEVWCYLKNYYPDLDSIQIDGIYTCEGKFLINEINYRKSMGQVALHFLKYFPNVPSIQFNLASKRCFNRPKRAVILSPENNLNDRFVSFINY